MRVNDRILMLHVPKTGGTFLSTVLDEMGLGLQTEAEVGLDKHIALPDVPDDLVKDRLILAPIRSPMSWYVSWFLHGSHSGPAAALLEPVADDPAAPTFLGTLPRMLAPGAMGVDTDAEIPYYPGFKPYATCAIENRGLCTTLYRYAYLDKYKVFLSRNLYLLPLENIRAEIPLALALVGYDGPALAEAVNLDDRPPIGARKYPGSGWADYYQPDPRLLHDVKVFDPPIP